MGFRPEPTIYKLVFEEDTGLAGLTVRARSCTIGEFTEMLRGSTDAELDFSSISDDDPMKALSAVRDYGRAAAAANDKTFAMFAKYLVEWDLEDFDGTPIPATLEGILSVEKPVLNKIIAAWHTAMMVVDTPLPKASTNGRSSEEAILGLGNSSVSQPNWPTPNS
jgi:hypothetical protein